MSEICLGDICTIKSSKRIFESEYVEDGVPFIRGQEITDNSIGKSDAKYECYISADRYNELKVSNGVPKRGDILITSVGTIGNLCYVDFDMPFYYKDGNIIQFTDFSDNVYSRYLYYFMQSPYFKKQLDNALIGAVQKALTMVMLKDIHFELPSVQLQKDAVKVLDAIDAKIALNNSICSDLEAMAKLLYDYWFVQFDFPDENGKPYKSSGGKMVWNEELKREIPGEWKVHHLDDIANIKTGKEDANFATVDGEYAYFTCGKETLKCDTPAFNGHAILLAGNGDFNVKHYTGEFNAYQRTYVIMPKEDCFYGIATICVKNAIDRLTKSSVGSIVKFITLGDVTGIDILVPNNTSLLKPFNTIVEIIEKLNDETKELTSLRDFLLPMLMNGQVKIKEKEEN